MAHRQALAAGVVVGGDYEIEKVLGAGGFGITYLARDRRLDRKVAVKEYFPSSLAFRDDGVTVAAIATDAGVDFDWGLDRFLTEAQTLARLSHPNIVKVTRYFKENSTAYMVLEFVEGQDFEGWLRGLGRPPTQAELDKIVAPLLDALAFVHKADVVHRDIKPENIYIRESDGAPILLDFGAARQALGQHSRATAAFVSPGYSPPESHLTDPKEQGPWTDIYGLAASLYRALVGKAPTQVLNRVANDTYVPLGNQLENAKDYRATFLSAVDRGMRLRREDRPKTTSAWRPGLLEDVAEATTTVVSSGDSATVVAGGGEADAQTRISTGGQSAPKNDLTRWAIVAAALLMLVTGLHQIYTSFDSTPQPVQPPPQTPQSPETTPNQPGGGEPNRQQSGQPTPTPNQPAAEPSTPQPNQADVPNPPPANQLTYQTYKNPRFGYEFEYPNNYLMALPPPANGAGQAFSDASDKFRVNSFAAFNSEGLTSAALRQQVQETDPVFRNATVAREDATRFSLVGTHQGVVHAYIAILSCQGQLLNVLQVSFPDIDAGGDANTAITTRMGQSFRPGQGADGPANCGPQQAPQVTEPPPAAPAQTPTPQFGADTPNPNAFGGDISLSRLARFGWSEGGLQNGLWAAGVHGTNGTFLYLRCSLGPGPRRDGVVELRQLVTGNTPLTGQHQVNVTIGTYQDGGVFGFTPAQGFSNGLLQFSESQETAGQYLGFLNQLVQGQTMVLQIPSIGYQETFGLFDAWRALGPCLGRPIVQSWTNHGVQDNVTSASIRNARGGTFIIRCDATPASRGNAIVAFAAPRSINTAVPALGSLRVSIGSRFIDLQFQIEANPGVLSGALYHVAVQQNNSGVRDFFSSLSRGSSMRIDSNELGVQEQFSLRGSSRALSGCLSLY